MKNCIHKFVLSLLLSFFSLLTPALGNPEFIPSSSGVGTLKLSAVDIGGVKAYENVELELDMSNGTFRITKATPADLRIPEDAVLEAATDRVIFGFRGCSMENRSVTCHVVFTSKNVDRYFQFFGSNIATSATSKLYDDKGNVYAPSRITVANSEDLRAIERTFVANTPTAATIRFDNVSAEATGISLLTIIISFTPDNNCNKSLLVSSDCEVFEIRDVKF